MATPAVSPQGQNQIRTLRWTVFYCIVPICTLAVLPFVLWPSLKKEVFSSDFLPHLYCYLGSPGLVWTHVSADVLIGVSYFAISATLAYIVHVTRQELPFRWIFLAFGLFIVSCGLTHILEAVTVWIPIYIFQAVVKLATASASVATAALLPFTVKPIRSLLAKAKASEEHRQLLESAITERDAAQRSLRESYNQLETKVRERTAELAETNRDLEHEIAERKRAEGWLAELAAIVEFSDDAIITKDLQGTITTWNHGAERLYGYSAAEAIGRPISLIMSADHEHEFGAILEKIHHDVRVEHFETVRIRKGGQPLTVSLTVSPIKDPAGKVIAASVIGRDISANKAAEEAMRRSEEQYRLLFDNNPMPMWVFDCETLAFMATNEAATKHYGYSRKEFLDMTILDIRPTEDIPELLRSHQRSLKELSYTGLWKHRKKDGTLIDVEVSANGLVLNGRQAQLVLAKDVTEQIRGEQKLQEVEERFSTAFRCSPLPISISTLEEGRYVDINDAFLQIVGYRREELIGRSSVDIQFWPDAQSRNRFVQQFKEQGRLREFETQLMRKDGEARTIQVSAELIQLGGVPCILAISNDITEPRRLEQQLRQAQKMEAVGRLAGGVAHDFNNVLGVIIGYSELVQTTLDGDNPLREQVAEIKRAADRGAALTRQLLAFSRQQILQPTIINLNDVVSNVSNMLKRMVAEDVEVSFIPEPLLGNVYVDRGQVEQILMNLAVNARDAMPSGGRLIIATANVQLDESQQQQHSPVRPGTYVRLSVTDTGIGMDAATMSHIFEPFFTTKELGHGTGLGLSIVYGIIKQSGGYIWVHSEPGRGTTFKIDFPKVDADTESSNEIRYDNVPIQGTETLLLVEDDEALRKLTVKLLASAGYTVLEAGDAGSAINTAKRHKGKISLLLSDVVMAGVSGPELATQLRSMCSDLKVIFISGYAGDLIARHGALDSRAVVIEKPFTKSTLLSRIHTVLHG